MIPVLGLVAFVTLVYAFAAWLLTREPRPRRRRWTHRGNTGGGYRP